MRCRCTGRSPPGCGDCPRSTAVSRPAAVRGRAGAGTRTAARRMTTSASQYPAFRGSTGGSLPVMPALWAEGEESDNAPGARREEPPGGPARACSGNAGSLSRDWPVTVRPFPLPPRTRPRHRDPAASSPVRVPDRGDSMDRFGLGGNWRLLRACIDAGR